MGLTHMQGSLPAHCRRLNSSIAMEAYADLIALDNGGHLTPIAVPLQCTAELGVLNTTEHAPLGIDLDVAFADTRQCISR